MSQPSPSFPISNSTFLEPYVDAQEAARFIGVNPKTVTRLARAGMVPAHPIGNGQRRRWRFLKSELDIWMRGRVNSTHHLRSHKEETH